MRNDIINSTYVVCLNEMFCFDNWKKRPTRYLQCFYMNFICLPLVLLFIECNVSPLEDNGQVNR